MKKYHLLFLLSIIVIVMVGGCGDKEEIIPRPTTDEQKTDTIPDTPDTPQDPTSTDPNVYVTYSLTVPADLCERGRVIATYLDDNGQKITKELSKGDFTTNENLMTWEYKNQFKHFDVRSYAVIQFKYTTSQHFVCTAEATAKSTRGDEIVGRLEMPKPTSVQNLNVIGSGSEASVDLLRFGFSVDEAGKISNLSEEEMAFTDEQRQFIKECSLRLLNRIKGEWEKVTNPETVNEHNMAKFSEQSPNGLFEEPLVFTLDVWPQVKGDEVVMWITRSVRKASDSFGVSGVLVVGEQKDDVFKNLGSSDFQEQVARSFEKMIMDNYLE